MSKAYQERLIALVKDTISLLCKNGLEYNQEFCVEGLLGVTLDKDEVFLIPIKELVADKGVSTTDATDEAAFDSPRDGQWEDDGRRSPKRERKKKRRHAEATVTRDEATSQYEEGSSSVQFETEPSEWGAESKARVTDQADQEKDQNETDDQPSFKRQRQREERRANLSNVKAEDIVVIKEEVDDEEFADAFQDGSLDSTMNQTNPGDTSMAFFPPPGTSQSSMNFSIDQLTGGQGLSGATLQGLPAGAEGDASWLQQSPGDMQGQPGDWQGQKHQMQVFNISSIRHRQAALQSDVSEAFSPRRDYACDICGELFSRTSSVTRHKLGVHQGIRFQCDICLKTFSQKAHMTHHRKVNHAEAPFHDQQDDIQIGEHPKSEDIQIGEHPKSEDIQIGEHPKSENTPNKSFMPNLF